MDGWMNGWMDERMEEWMGGSKDGWMDGRMDGWKEGRKDGWMDGWKEGWMDGWMDGWMEGWKNGRMDGSIVRPIFAFLARERSGGFCSYSVFKQLLVLCLCPVIQKIPVPKTGVFEIPSPKWSLPPKRRLSILVKFHQFIETISLNKTAYVVIP
jgi:hypothetical protein